MWTIPRPGALGPQDSFPPLSPSLKEPRADGSSVGQAVLGRGQPWGCRVSAQRTEPCLQPCLPPLLSPATRSGLAVSCLMSPRV